MAQRRSIAWAELRVGLLVVISFALLATAIFFIGGQKEFFGPKYTVTAYFANANNLKKGAEVQLEGVTIGNVTDVRISKLPDPDKSVETDLKLSAKYQNIIRSDSKVRIRTIGILGDSAVDITRGSEKGKVIDDGGTVQGSEEGDIRRIVSNTNDFVANLQVLSDDIKKMAERVDRGEGTLGKFLTDTSIYDNADATVTEFHGLVRDARTGNGTVARFLNDDEAYRKFTEIEDHMDSLVLKIEQGNGTVAKMLNDSSMYNRADDILAKFQSVADRIDRGEGTLGKFAKDEALYNDFRSSVTKFNSLMNSIENGEGSAGKFIKDPTFYNSFTQTSSEIQKLLYDFRQNPKKFMTINFKLF